MDATTAFIMAAISLVVTVGNFIFRINFDTQSQRRKNALDFMAKIANDVYLYRTAHVDMDKNTDDIVYHQQHVDSVFHKIPDTGIDHRAELARCYANQRELLSNVLKTQGALISDRFILSAVFSGDVKKCLAAISKFAFYSNDVPDRPLSDEEKKWPFKKLDELGNEVLKEVNELYQRNNRHNWSEESLRYSMEESFPMDNQKPEIPKS